jgi:hypothetical protein
MELGPADVNSDLDPMRRGEIVSGGDLVIDKALDGHPIQPILSPAGCTGQDGCAGHSSNALLNELNLERRLHALVGAAGG